MWGIENKVMTKTKHANKSENQDTFLSLIGSCWRTLNWVFRKKTIKILTSFVLFYAFPEHFLKKRVSLKEVL